MIPDKLLVSEHFPRSSQYHPEWTTSSVSGGANSLWLTEWLAATLDLHAACEFLIWAVDGRYCQSSFLRREFGVLVGPPTYGSMFRKMLHESRMPA